MADRVAEFWLTFADVFGAPAVESKYGEKCPAVWRASILSLNDFEFARGCRRLLRFRKGVPSLPEFLNLCREVGSDEDPNTRPPSFRLAPPADHEFDAWDQRANLKLLRHITQPERLGRYGGSDAELLRPLLDHKRQWALEMREAAADHSLPQNGDDSWWNDRMERAEREVDEIRIRRSRDAA